MTRLAIQVLLTATRQDHTQHPGVRSAELPPCFLETFGVVEDEPQPKLIVISEEIRVQFLVESVIEQDKLVFASVFPRH